MTTDGLNLYLSVVDSRMRDRVDYAVLHKLYGGGDEGRRCSSAVVTGVEGRAVMGNPDPEKGEHVPRRATNLTMPMEMRRFIRPTNGFSKKAKNLADAVSRDDMHYNFARPHETLGKGVTPAMAAGQSEVPSTVWDIASLLD